MNCVSKEPIKYTRPLKHQNVFRLQHKEEMLAQIHLISTFILLRLAACVQVDLDPPFPGADQPCYQEVPHNITKLTLTISQFKLQCRHVLQERQDVQGFCETDSCCDYDFVISGLCPSYPANVKVFYPIKNTENYVPQSQNIMS